MPANSLWWLEGDDPLDPDMDLDLDDELGNIFGDIVGAVGKIAAAPVNLVASALPKPIREPFKAVHAFASPTAMLDPATRKRAAGVISGGLRGGAKASASTSARRRSIRAILNAKAKGKTSKPKTVSLSSLGKAGASDDLMKRMVEILGAKDIAKIAAGAKPRLQARSTGTPGAADKAMAAAVASAVIKQMSPTLKTINAKLSLAENQRLATSEHNAINNVTAFRRKVLQDLMRISSCLPESHPTRQRIRRVGIMSGLL